MAKFIPPDRPLSYLDKWVVVYNTFDSGRPRSDRYALSDPEPHDNEKAARDAANTARSRLQRGTLKIIYAIAYPPITTLKKEPHVVTFR